MQVHKCVQWHRAQAVPSKLEALQNKGMRNANPLVTMKGGPCGNTAHIFLGAAPVSPRLHIQSTCFLSKALPSKCEPTSRYGHSSDTYACAGFCHVLQAQHSPGLHIVTLLAASPQLVCCSTPRIKGEPCHFNCSKVSKEVLASRSAPV